MGLQSNHPRIEIAMPIFILTTLLTVALVIHALKSGQDRFWVWILILAPMIGNLAYFAIVLLPEFMGSHTAQKAGAALRDKIDPERGVREAREQLELADTAQNRVRLADALMVRDDAHEAGLLYEEALSGMFANDPTIIFKLGQARLELNRPSEALDLFNRARAAKMSALTPSQELLVCRALADTGAKEQAIELLTALVPRFAGEEARCFYAKTLSDAGRLPEAREVISEILKREQRSPAHLKRDQKTWYDWARAQNY
jgi:hypothetical protein